IAFVGIILTKSPVGMVAISVSALLVVWRFFPRAVVPCGARAPASLALPRAAVPRGLVLLPFIYLSAPATVADWRDSVCGPNGALCDLLTRGSWLQLLLGTGARTLGEAGLAAAGLDPQR